MSDLKHVMFDGIEALEPEQLVEVAGDAATLHQMVMDEFAAREARTAAAKAAAAALKPGGATGKAGRKKKSDDAPAESVRPPADARAVAEAE